MSNSYVRAGNEPGPRDVLQALRQAIVDDSRLRTTPVPELVSQFIAGGYLHDEPSAYLVIDVLEILRAGGLGLRSPTLQPCMIEVYWNEGWQDDIQDELYMAIEWVGGPDIWEE